MTSDERKARIHRRTMEDPIWRDGIDACCTDRCTDACGGYGRMLEASASDGTKPATAQCCGSKICGTGIVGMFALGGDLARRAKDIVRGRPVEDTP